MTTALPLSSADIIVSLNRAFRLVAPVPFNDIPAPDPLLVLLVAYACCSGVSCIVTGPLVTLYLEEEEGASGTRLEFPLSGPPCKTPLLLVVA